MKKEKDKKSKISSQAGSLKKYFNDNETSKNLIDEIHKERKQSNRF